MILDFRPFRCSHLGGLDLEIWSNKNNWEKKRKNKKEGKEITVPAPKDSIILKNIFGGVDI